MTQREPIWLEKAAIIVLHDRSLALHGGPSGIRDEGLLGSALQRPVNRFFYEGEADIAALAATYCVGIASNHPFIDGNKRAAYQALILFLALNGQPLAADRVDAINTMLAVAAGQIDIDELSRWIRTNSTAP
ncbi:type II toxin-antitoxin system death-on-curing family toxin [Brevundimonas sp.]|uniref:type II toxin-antitoxin system death-on-curing family toxin n=1 Tax=Brevundimonas sp. TaxID=1871086 RepID=UPI002AB90070|nr:type II toxin-antitoxin system death-on-curing family toxin [Brevundimonas sp.]MDZ4363339.1 type II toxin-antitoxin system death-on-curing family toxin [Brevundimonas sp.]